MDRHQVSSQPVTIFYSYAREDELLRKKLHEHLSGLRRQGIVTKWHGRRVVADAKWEDTVDPHLNSASLILLLVSPSFLASDYCFSVEMQRALERHHAGEARVIPVILRPVDWQHAPLADLQCLPRDAKPVVSWSNQDEAFLNVTHGIREALESVGIISIPSQISLFVWNVPYPRNLFFTGREEIIETLASSLKVDRTTALTQPHAISGLGGVGKTQIAVEYAYRYRSLYQAVLWAQAETHESLVASFAAIAQVLKLPGKDARDQTIVANGVMEWMRTHTAWLLILDNSDDLNIARAFIPPLFSGHILLTTRVQATGRLARRIEVEEMSPEVGALLLLRRATLIPPDAPLEQANAADRETALKIVRELGGLPLALDQAGAYIEGTNCSLPSYLKLFQSQSMALLKRRGELIIDHPASVATTWLISFEQIKQKNPVAAELLFLCAFLYPDSIPEEIAIKGMALLNEHALKIETDLLFFNDLLETLRTASFVKRDTVNHILSIHRLVQATLKNTMSAETYQQWTERAVRAVNEVFPRPEFSAWPLCERCITNAQVCASLIEREDMLFPEVTNLLNNAGRYLKERGQYGEAERFLQQALARRERYFGLMHPETATSLNNLGNLSFAQGKYSDAEQFQRRALAIREQSLGTDHPVTGISFNNVGWMCYALGKYTEAEEFYGRALAIYYQHLGAEHSDTITTITNLAWLYYRQGRYPEAEQLYAQVLTSYQVETIHPNKGRILNNLALLYTMQARYAEAECLQKQAHTIWEQCYGSEHSETMMSLTNLAVLYQKQGKFAEAEQLYTQVLVFRERHLGTPHPDTAKALRNLAGLYTEQGKYAEAEPLYIRALAIREKYLGGDHPETAVSLNDLAFLFYKEAKYSEAESLYMRALALSKQQLGPESLDVALYLYNLAQLYDTQGNHPDTEKLYAQALAIREQCLGQLHPDTISTMKSYASFLRKIQRMSESEQLEARFPGRET